MGLQSRGMLLRPAEERVKDFESALILDEEWAKYEASRCIHCYGFAACQRACPAGNDISRALWYIEQGQFLEAAHVFRKTNSLPEACGRLCPQEKLCEGACVRNRRGESVLIGALEAFVTEHERQVSQVKIPRAELTGRKVAVIGAGPAGLACAEQLVKRGHWVTIFDSRPAPGGALVYGIPNFKLPKKVFSDIWESLKQAGVTFVGRTYIGKKITVNDLFADGYEAIFIGVGSILDVSLGVPGENLPGVYKATDFLLRANVDKALLLPRMRTRPQVGARVVVIGGGDPATDCLRTARRLGAQEVTCLYRYTEAEIPGRERDRQFAIEEGVKFLYNTLPVRLIAGVDQHVVQVECVRFEIGQADETGQLHPAPVEGSNFMIDVDNVVIAAGYYPDPIISATTPGLKTHKWGLLIGDPETGSTSRFGVFTGGDVVTGPDMVVTAMVAGRKAAVTIDAYLG